MFNDSNAAQKAISSFKSSDQIGVRFEECQDKIRVGNFRNNEWKSQLAGHKNKNNWKIIVVVLENSSKKCYPDIKEFIDKELAIPSQMLKKENDKKGLSFYSNIIKQMVVKVGGELFNIILHKNLNSDVIYYLT